SSDWDSSPSPKVGASRGKFETEGLASTLTLSDGTGTFTGKKAAALLQEAIAGTSAEDSFLKTMPLGEGITNTEAR
ncbi:unnamed protein product, partial [Amoebophrya sp. A25]